MAKAKRKTVRRLKGGERLDYRRALQAAAKGATLKNIAKAAGSQAKREHLARVGLKIVRRLSERGVIFETFNRLGYTIEEFCRGVIEGTRARRTTRYYYEGKLVGQHSDIDHHARTRAREQYLTAIGVKQLPLEAGERGDPLDVLSDEELEALLIQDERSQAGS